MRSHRSKFISGPVAVVASALALAACSSSAGWPDRGGPSTSPGSIRSMLLRADEVPAEYHEAPPSFSDRDEPSYDTACGQVPPSAAKATATFQQGLLGPFIFDSVAVYDDVDAAITAYEDIAVSCAREVNDRGDQSTTVTLAEVPFAAIGDRTIAAQMTGTIAGIAFRGELVMVAKGSVVSVIVMAGSPTVDTSSLEGIVRSVAARMP